jgi:hypothetical protein
MQELLGADGGVREGFQKYLATEIWTVKEEGVKEKDTMLTCSLL